MLISCRSASDDHKPEILSNAYQNYGSSEFTHPCDAKIHSRHKHRMRGVLCHLLSTKQADKTGGTGTADKLADPGLGGKCGRPSSSLQCTQYDSRSHTQSQDTEHANLQT